MTRAKVSGGSTVFVPSLGSPRQGVLPASPGKETRLRFRKVSGVMLSLGGTAGIYMAGPKTSHTQGTNGSVWGYKTQVRRLVQ